MADRRMISKRIINSAKFQKMPISSQLLYFYLCLEADDDGVVEAYRIMRQVGSGEDDIRVLVAKGLVIILNEDLVAYITDWREHNSLRADRKIDSFYKDLLIRVVPDAKLLERKPRADRKEKFTDENACGTSQGQSGDGLGEDSIGKDRTGKNNNNDAIRDVVIGSSLSDSLTNKIFEWLDYKKEKKQTYKPKGLQTLLNKVKDIASVYGDDPVCEAIDKAMMSNYSGFFLDNIPKYYKPVEHIVIEPKGGGRE